MRAVVMTAVGEENFSVGMDLKELPRGIKEKGGTDALFDQRLNVLSAIERMGKPWVTTLFGYCLGGGLELPLACHFRLAANEGAKIGLPEMHLGTVPAWGGSARLTRRVGRDHAIDLILRAKTISGPEALRIGLVNEVWPNARTQDPRHLTRGRTGFDATYRGGGDAELHRQDLDQNPGGISERRASGRARDLEHAGSDRRCHGLPREAQARVRYRD